jgi:hypothetical protein
MAKLYQFLIQYLSKTARYRDKGIRCLITQYAGDSAGGSVVLFSDVISSFKYLFHFCNSRPFSLCFLGWSTTECFV